MVFTVHSGRVTTKHGESEVCYYPPPPKIGATPPRQEHGCIRQQKNVTVRGEHFIDNFVREVTAKRRMKIYCQHYLPSKEDRYAFQCRLQQVQLDRLTFLVKIYIR
jgi:hypothetical protein